MSRRRRPRDLESGETASFVPSDSQVVEMVAMLVGRAVTLEDQRPADAIPEDGLLGAYICDDGRLGAVAYSDLSFAAHAGAALAMVPVQTAEDDVKSGALGEELRENFYEVLNIMAAMFPDAGGPHVKLNQFISAPMPAKVVRANELALGRLGVTLSIEGYGSGSLSIATF